MRYEKFDDHDPYFQGKVNQTQTNFLNFAPSMSPNNPEMLFYSGNAFSLSRRFSSISDRELQQYKEVRMNVTGSQIKEGNRCCVLWTIIMGSIFLFPLFFICCDWWKKMTNKLYHVEN